MADHRKFDGVYYGVTKTLPSGETVYCGDLLTAGTPKWDLLKGDPHVWRQGDQWPVFKIEVPK